MDIHGIFRTSFSCEFVELNQLASVQFLVSEVRFRHTIGGREEESWHGGQHQGPPWRVQQLGQDVMKGV